MTSVAEAATEDMPIRDDGVPASTATPPGPLVSTWDFVRMLLVLCAVVGLIYVVFLLLKKGTRRKAIDSDVISVIGSKTLAGSNALHVVGVGKNVYLIGSSDGGVSLISEILDKESVDAISMEASAAAVSSRRSFSDVLSELFKQIRTSERGLGDSVDYVRQQRARLERLK